MSTHAPTARGEAAAVSGWAKPVRLWQPRNPAYWLYLWLVLNGAWIYLVALTSDAVPPSVYIMAITSQVLYTGLFVWFFTRADRYEREPAKLAAIAFVFSGLVSTWMIAAPANGALISLWSKWISIDFAIDWAPAITAPLTEETAKLAAVGMCALLARHHVRSTYDGLILGLFAGLGFQVFENVEYMVRSAQGNFNSDPTTDVMAVFISRGISGFFGHWTYTAIAGAGLGYYLGNPQRSKGHRLAVAGGLLLIAMISHGLWDSVLAIGQPAILLSVAVGLPVFILLLRFTERRSRAFVTDLLADDLAMGTVTEDELAYLTGTLHDRRKHLRSIKHAEGKGAAQRAEWVMEAQNHLAAAIARTDDPHSPDAEAARAEVARLRTVNV